MSLVKDKTPSHTVKRKKNWKGMRYTMDIMKKDFCCVTLNKITLEQGSES